MPNPENTEERTVTQQTIEQQANCEELDSLVLFDRLHDPDIRKQIIDLIEQGSQAFAGEHKKKVYHYKDGKPQFDKNGNELFVEESYNYVPDAREVIERNFDASLKQIEQNTPITFKPGEEPQTSGNKKRREKVSVNYELPWTNEKITPKQQSIIEAHEKGHVVRRYWFPYIREKFGVAFDINALRYTEADYEQYWRILAKERQKQPSFEEARLQQIKYLFSGPELAERMSQLKNFFGMKGDELFTKEHLDYARDHYIADTGMDNAMTHFFQAITPEKEEDFLKLINSAGI